VCLVLALLLAALSFRFYLAEAHGAAVLCAVGALGFAVLMVRNVRRAMLKKKETTRDDH